MGTPLAFSMYGIAWYAKRDSFTSTFLIWMPLFLFLTLSRTYNTTLNKYGESKHPYLVCDLRRKAFSFSLLSMMLAVGLSYVGGLYYVDVHSRYTCFVKSFFFRHKWMLNFVKCFFCISQDHMIFIFHFVNVVYHTD